MKTNSRIFCLLLLLVLQSQICTSTSNSYIVPFGGNAWPTTGGSIDDNGYTFIALPAAATLYAYVSTSGTANVTLNLNSANNPVIVTVQIGNNRHQISQGATPNTIAISIGSFGMSVRYNQIFVSITGANATTTGVLASLAFNGSVSISNFVSNSAEFDAGRTGFGTQLTFNLPNKGIYKVNSAYSETS